MSYKIGRNHTRNGTIQGVSKTPTFRIIVLPGGKRPEYSLVPVRRWNRQGKEITQLTSAVTADSLRLEDQAPTLAAIEKGK